jgi:hypothetical protein
MRPQQERGDMSTAVSKGLARRLDAEMSEDGYRLSYLPANQAYTVTFGDDPRTGSRIIGPCPLRVAADWWADMQDRETDMYDREG